MPFKKYFRRAGNNPLAYIGVAPSSTSQFTAVSRAPTTEDKRGYKVGDFWLDTTTTYVWLLVSLAKNAVTKLTEATWVIHGEYGTGLRQINADTGSAMPGDFQIDMFGFSGLTTTGSGNTITLSLVNGTDGQVYIGGGIGPTLANITSTGATITITNGSNTINIESAGGSAVLQIAGDTGIATPLAATITIAGGVNITTAAAVKTVTVNLDDSIVLATGLTISLLGAGVMQTSAVGLVSSSKGTDGQVLIGSTAGVPAWANITSAGATLTITDGPNSIGLDANLAATFYRLGGDTGEATTLTGTVNVLGGTNMNTAGAGSTCTVNLDNSLVLATGLTISLLGAGVMQTDAAGLVSSSKGTDGQLIIGSTAGVPAWASVTSTSLSILEGANTLSIEKSSDASASPPFLYYQQGDTLSGAFQELGATKVMTKIFDEGSHVFPGDGAGNGAYFLVPITGNYVLTCQATHTHLTSTTGTSPALGASITGDVPYFLSRHIKNCLIPSGTLNYAVRQTGVFRCTIGQKIYFRHAAIGGTVNGSVGATSIVTWFSGFLVEV